MPAPLFSVRVPAPQWIAIWLGVLACAESSQSHEHTDNNENRQYDRDDIDNRRLRRTPRGGVLRIDDLPNYHESDNPYETRDQCVNNRVYNKISTSKSEFKLNSELELELKIKGLACP